MPRTPRPRRGRHLVVSAIAAVALASGASVVVSTWAWAGDVPGAEQLAPGTTIGSVDVGGLDADAAAAAVEAHLEMLLTRPVALAHEELRWTTSAEQLGASVDVAAAVAGAVRAAGELDLVDRARLRWGTTPSVLARPLHLEVPEEAAAELIDTIAEAVEREPRDAAASWRDGALVVERGRDGAWVDRPVAVEGVRTAVAVGDRRVELPVEPLRPAVSTDAVASVVDEVTEAVDAALDRPLRLHGDGGDRSLTPRELGAEPRLGPLLDRALARQGLEPVGVDADPDVVADHVADLAEEIDVAPADATVAVVDGAVTTTPERVGRALDRDAAVDDVVAALAAGADDVALPVETRQPSVTEASLRERLLVVDQAARRVELRRDGEVVRSWPVAVGAGGSPTPTGVFTVGAKRHEPTWHNPSPSGWGSGMPASIGPGPDNPLGARALNWERDGADTLIRFHGTPDVDSIGSAASKGCVRMLDGDVIELYDLVPTGTPIVSIGG